MLAGAPHYDLSWLIVAILLVLAFVPIALAVATTVWAATRPSIQEQTTLMLHFAYGSNMHRAVMRKHAPGAEPVGVATLGELPLRHHRGRLCLGRAGAAQSVYGMLWRLTPRDRVTLDAWENVAGGLYRAETLAVHQAGQHTALVYIARIARRGGAAGRLHGGRDRGGADGNARRLHC